HHLEAGELVVERVRLGAEADAAQHLRVREGRGAADAELADARAREPRDEAHEGGLARAVRPEQAPDAWVEVQRHVRERGDLPVPFAEPDCADRCGLAHAITSARRSLPSVKVTAPTESRPST